MSGAGFAVSGGEMLITKDGRTVLDTAGSLVLGLPSSYDYVTGSPVTLTFPDVTKSWAYNWRWSSTYTGGGGENYSVGNTGFSWVTALAAEVAIGPTTLAAVPPGCNLAAVLMRINRTTSPSHTWDGKSLLVKPPTNVWIPYTGSVLLEEVVGFARAMTLAIEGSNLVLRAQQSVGAAPSFTVNNVTDDTMDYGATSSGPPAGGTSANGGEWARKSGTDIGQLVYNIASASDTGSISLATPGPPPFSPSNALGDCRRTSNGDWIGTKAASLTDPTNYSSVYSLDFRVSFAKATT